MEAVVIAFANGGRTDRVRSGWVERRRRGWLAVLVSGLFGLALLSSQRNEARGQPQETPPAVPDGGLRPRTVLARNLKASPHPGARSGSENPSSAGETAARSGPASVSKPAIPPAPPRPLEKRFKVRDDYGRLVVARLHGQIGEKTAVVLPDGQVGRLTAMPVPVDEPFRPMSADELAPLLQQGPFAKFLLLRTDHYLIFYQSSQAFAQDSGRLLEEVYRGLLEAFTRNGIPVHQSEFPLVAVIYATERDFRDEKKLESQVRAYYELTSNRIFFYQRSERDEREPKLAALLKPQTVAHEGVHQVLCNIGVQPRLSPWPLWLVEGMAEYCATTKASKKGGVTWAGLGGVNSLNMATIREIDDTLPMEIKGGTLPSFPVSRRQSVSRTETLVSETRLTPTDYAFAWSLTHYLAQTRRVDFVKYLKHLNQLAPLAPRSPDEQLADFQTFFGEDLAKLDKKIDEYVRNKLSKKEHDPLPHYAVLFEHPLPNGAVKRIARVSQSPQMIQQWKAEIEAATGGQFVWQAYAYPTHARASYEAERWANGY
jgi:hypothetical protein